MSVTQKSTFSGLCHNEWPLLWNEEHTKPGKKSLSSSGMFWCFLVKWQSQASAIQGKQQPGKELDQEAKLCFNFTPRVSNAILYPQNNSPGTATLSWGLSPHFLGLEEVLTSMIL